MVDYGDPQVRVIIDPIDGSLNAKRGIPHHALSLAVADGATMADVAFGFVYEFGPREEWWARRGDGAWLNGDATGPLARRAPRADGRMEVLGIESADPRWVAASIEPLADTAYRLRALGRSPRRSARSPPAGSTGWCRCAGAWSGHRGRAADRPRGRRIRVLPELPGAAGGAARCRALLARGRRARSIETLRRLEADRGVIDWILAERIAGLSPGPATRGCRLWSCKPLATSPRGGSRSTRGCARATAARARGNQPPRVDPQQHRLDAGAARSGR